jgi:hypothetical protein
MRRFPISSDVERRGTRYVFEIALATLAAMTLAPPTGHADAPALELSLTAPDLAVGDRKSLRAELLVGDLRLGPVMLTPSAEGAAVEVVRGRLTGDDAEPFTADDGRRGLRFAIPVAAHMAGTSVVRVHANVYGCHVGCAALETSAQLAVRVQRAPAEGLP